jgi:hypothetical protein
MSHQTGIGSPIQLVQLELERVLGSAAADFGESSGPQGSAVAPAADDSDGRANAPPPIVVTVAADGRVILSPRDTKALDRIEDLLGRIAPPPKDYKVFYLKYALASLVTLNLEEYFEEEGDFDTEENRYRAWMGLGFNKGASSGGSLAQRQEIRKVSGSLNSAALQAALAKALGASQPTAKTDATEQPPGQQEPPAGQDANPKASGRVEE